MNLVRQIRDHPLLCDSWIVYVVERNQSDSIPGLHMHILNNEEKVSKIEYFRESLNKPVGIFTTHELKTQYRLQLQEELAVNSIKFAEKLIVFNDNPNKHQNAEIEQEMKDELFAIMLRATITRKQASDDNPRSLTWTGKVGGFRDDLLLAFCFGVWAIRRVNDPRSGYASRLV